MDIQLSWLRRSAAGLLALLAVSGAAPVAAGMFATEGAITNFTFSGGDVQYSIPSVGEVAVQLSPDNAVELRARDADGNRGAFDPESGFTAKLNLGAKLNDAAPTGDGLMIFGSIPSAQDSDAADLMSGTLDAMQEDGDEGSLSFLIPDQPTTGTLAQQYQSIGIYAHPAGADMIAWASGYEANAGSSSANLAGQSDQEQDGRSATAAIPAPATAVLMLVGLFGLGFWQRRASNANASLAQGL
jgi:hypothetical protein